MGSERRSIVSRSAQRAMVRLIYIFFSGEGEYNFDE